MKTYLLAVLGITVFSLWRRFRPHIDLTDMSFSTRGWRKAFYWSNTWHTWFAFRCTCGDWTWGCGEHRFCGMCPACKRIHEAADGLDVES